MFSFLKVDDRSVPVGSGDAFQGAAAAWVWLCSSRATLL
jgi:hypothetical protein